MKFSSNKENRTNITQIENSLSEDWFERVQYLNTLSRKYRFRRYANAPDKISAVKRTSRWLPCTAKSLVPSCDASSFLSPSEVNNSINRWRGYAQRSSRVCKCELPICRSETKSNTQLGSSSFPIVLTSE